MLILGIDRWFNILELIPEILQKFDENSRKFVLFDENLRKFRVHLSSFQSYLLILRKAMQTF